MSRILNDIFEDPYHMEMIGVSFNLQIKSSDKINRWTDGNILRVSNFADPEKLGIAPPYILTMLRNADSTFYPNKKDRNTVVCGILSVFEEPFSLLDDGVIDVTFTSVVEEYKRILAQDMKLKLPDNVPKVERMESFGFADLEHDVQEDKVTVLAIHEARYIVDLNIYSRARM